MPTATRPSPVLSSISSGSETTRRRSTPACKARAAAGQRPADRARRGAARHVTKLQEAQARRNAASKEIGKAKAAKDEAKAQELMAEVAALKEVIPAG